MVMPVLDVNPNEFVALNVPPPLQVVDWKPHHVPVKLLADEMVAGPLETSVVLNSVNADDELPVTVKVVIVYVIPAPNITELGAATASDAMVAAEFDI